MWFMHPSTVTSLMMFDISTINPVMDKNVRQLSYCLGYPPISIRLSRK